MFLSPTKYMFCHRLSTCFVTDLVYVSHRVGIWLSPTLHCLIKKKILVTDLCKIVVAKLVCRRVIRTPTYIPCVLSINIFIACTFLTLNMDSLPVGWGWVLDVGNCSFGPGWLAHFRNLTFLPTISLRYDWTSGAMSWSSSLSSEIKLPHWSGSAAWLSALLKMQTKVSVS